MAQSQVTTGQGPMPGLETPEEKVLRNPLILNLILAHPQWTPSQLKSFRQVTKMWRFVSTAELLRRDCLQVRLTDDPHDHLEESYYSVSQLASDTTDGHPQRRRSVIPTAPVPPPFPIESSLEALNKCLKESTSPWPTTSFKFIGGQWRSEVATEFFSIQGKNIKTLTLCSDPRGLKYGMEKKDFHNILTDQTPNVEHLILDDLCFGFNWNFINGQEFMFLPKLKTLTLAPGNSDLPFVSKYFSENLNTVKMILLGSYRSLQSIRNVSPPYFRTILDTRKSDLVTQIVDFHFHFPAFRTAVADFTDFGQAGLGSLVHLKIVWPPEIDVRNLNMTTKTEIMRVINLIVESSRLTLQEVEVKGDVDEMATMCPLVLTGLSNLEKLSFTTNRRLERAPRSMQIGWDFPKLRHFEWRHADVDPILLENMANCNVTMMTLTRLEIMQKTLPIFGKEFLSRCPQVKFLKLHCQYDCRRPHQWLQNVVELDHGLEEVELIFDRMSGGLQNFGEAVPGIPGEVCNQIFYTNYKQKEANFESLRSAPDWLGSLNGHLKRLRITFTANIDRYTRCSDYRRPFPLTLISCLYTFEPVRSMKVRIACDKSDNHVDALIAVLEEIVPFATIFGL